MTLLQNRCKPRTERAQRNHIFMAIAAWFEQLQRCRKRHDLHDELHILTNFPKNIFF